MAVAVGSAAIMAASGGDALAAEEITCQEELGGADPNIVFVVACVVEALALTGAATGGEGRPSLHIQHLPIRSSEWYLCPLCDVQAFWLGSGSRSWR